MAGEEYVDVVNGEKILVQIGDGADPEVFTHDCMINAERGVNLTASTIQQSVPRCDDPSAPDLVTREPDAVDSVINGAGKLHSSSTLAWMQRVGKKVNIRVRQAGVWRIAGTYILTAFNVTGTVKNHTTASITLEQAAVPTITNDAG